VHLPILDQASYSHVYEIGYANKLHGLLIAWKASRFEALAKQLVLLDDLDFVSYSASKRRTGLSRVTRNIGLLVALRSRDGSGGVIISTHHLFWHARHAYERARQAGLLLREVRRFRDAGGWQSWPCFLAGGQFEASFPDQDRRA
jgi:RNA exonuclease NGL2